MLPYTIGDYLADYLNVDPVPTDDPAFREAESELNDEIRRFLSINGTRSVDWFHRELGKILLEHCGMERNRPGLEKALSEIPALREEFYSDVRVPGENESINSSLEKAGRVADFFELAELMCRDALDREESCGAHFRSEHQTEEGEARRNDADFSFVSVYEHTGNPSEPVLHREELDFEDVTLGQRSYK